MHSSTDSSVIRRVAGVFTSTSLAAFISHSLTDPGTSLQGQKSTQTAAQRPTAPVMQAIRRLPQGPSPVRGDGVNGCMGLSNGKVE
jgi:hypothetical protein